MGDQQLRAPTKRRSKVEAGSDAARLSSYRFTAGFVKTTEASMSRYGAGGRTNSDGGSSVDLGYVGWFVRAAHRVAASGRPAVARRTFCLRRHQRRAAPGPASTRHVGSTESVAKMSVASARMVSRLPSGRVTTSSGTPFQRLKPVAASSSPNNGCIDAVTCTLPGNTERKCCSLSPSLPAPAKPTC